MRGLNILHCDLNNFYASVECLDKPELRGKPVAVCGDEAERQGIVLAKNDAAKARGVKTAETIWQAKRKCPELITVPPHFEKYAYYSKWVREICGEFTNRIEPFGMDEAWLDISGCDLICGVGEEAAQKLRRKIKRETGLTVSVGVSFNKPFAKLGSDLKKPDAVTVISEENFKDKLWHLPAPLLIGVGGATEKKLRSLGIYTIGDLAAADGDVLRKQLGKCGAQLHLAALGMGDSEVASLDDYTPPKSVSKSVTCRRDIIEKEELLRVLLSLCESVCARLRSHCLAAECVSVSFKGSDLNVREHRMKLSFPSDLAPYIYRAAAELSEKLWNGEPIRAVGVCTSSLCGSEACSQLSIFCDYKKIQRTKKLEDSISDIRSRYGNAALKRAALISPLPFSDGKEQTPAFCRPEEEKFQR